MSNPEATFLELEDHVGAEHTHTQTETPAGVVVIEENDRAGDPGPLISQSLGIPIQTMAGGELITQFAHVNIEPSNAPCARDWQKAQTKDGVLACARIIPGTRVIETTAPPVVNVLQELHFRICDPPKALQGTRGRAASGGKPKRARKAKAKTATPPAAAGATTTQED